MRRVHLCRDVPAVVAVGADRRDARSLRRAGAGEGVGGPSGGTSRRHRTGACGAGRRARCVSRSRRTVGRIGSGSRGWTAHRVGRAGSSLFASMDAAFAPGRWRPGLGGVRLGRRGSTGERPRPGRGLGVRFTPETVEVARRHRGTSLVIGVTNVPGSPLADASDVVLPLLAGTEASGISTLTYRATVVVLGLLAGRFGLSVDADRFRSTDLGSKAATTSPRGRTCSMGRRRSMSSGRRRSWVPFPRRR